MKERYRPNLLRSPSSFRRLLGLKQDGQEEEEQEKEDAKRKRPPPSLFLFRSENRHFAPPTPVFFSPDHYYNMISPINSINPAPRTRKKERNRRRRHSHASPPLLAASSCHSTSLSWDTRRQLPKQQSTSSQGVRLQTAAPVGMRGVCVCAASIHHTTYPLPPSPLPADSPSDRTPLNIYIYNTMGESQDQVHYHHFAGALFPPSSFRLLSSPTKPKGKNTHSTPLTLLPSPPPSSSFSYYYGALL